MGRLIGHLKPYKWYVLLIFILLAGQAVAELALPDYMADIINVGIQQRGIDSPVPDVIRNGEMEKLSIFMTGDEFGEVKSHYRWLDRGSLSSDEYQSLVEEYPALADTPLYVLDTEDEAIIERLEIPFNRAVAAVAGITSGAFESVGGPSLPEGVNPFEYLASLPESDLEAMREMVDSILSTITRDMAMRSNVAYLSNEYEEIGIDVNRLQFDYMLPIGGLMLGITLLGSIAAIAVGFYSSRVAGGLGRDLRFKIFSKVESFSSEEYDRFSTASLITRSTNDIQQIQMLSVMLLRIAFFAPIMAIGGIIRVMSTDFSMWWVIAAALGAMLVLIGIQFSIAVPKFRIIQKLVDKVNLVTREMLSGLMVIRAFNTERYEENKFDKANIDLTKVHLFIQRIMVLMQPVMLLIMNGAMILIIWVGGKHIQAGTLQVGDMMAFMQYAQMIIFSFLMISIVFVMMPRAIVSVHRVNEVLDTDLVIRDPAAPVDFPEDVRGLVEFRDVTFSYPNAEEPVLKNISFFAQPGETTAIIGSTGCGKSTLINLIPRFYDVTSGQVLVDGVDVRHVTQRALREKVGYVPQKSVLFSGTVESNLRYANESADEELLLKAIASSQSRDFVKKAEGLKMPVAQFGANFSGGQKQRLSIARALVKQPEIFIFDDSFSALDFKTDSAVRRAVKRNTKNSTVFIVTQRVSTVMRAEQIIVLERGSIVGIGKHRELMKTCEVYREIAESQLSREELGS